MIYGVPPLPFSTADADRATITPAVAPDQANLFLTLLIQSVTRISEQAASPLVAPRPAAQPGSDARSGPPLGDNEHAVKDIFRFVFGQEGSTYVARDGGSESSRYGVLQGTANRYGYVGSVKDMSRADAEAIYKKMWEESGAQNLPPGLALVHFDTYVNSPAAAKKMLRASGGDVDTYLRLRSQRYTRLSELKPERYAKYMKGWMKRVQSLRTMAAAQMKPTPAKAST